MTAGRGGEGARGPAAAPSRLVTFAHAALSLTLELPACADALIDEAAFATDERLPYWADLWPSAVALARHLLDQPALEPRAIELGCGVGLVALALASRGVEVRATDYEPAALALVADNARRNGLPMPTTALLDWRTPGGEAAPLVVAADVLYEERHVEALACCVATTVAPNGRLLLADPGRRWLGTFLERMGRAGWVSREVARRHEEGTAPGARASEVRIVELARASRSGAPSTGALRP